jgi:short-subunit dehydrogenase
MPDTIRSLLFWLFMFLRMGSVETKSGRSPALLRKNLDSLNSVVPSLREALQPFSTVVVTGGSSGIGKSFIQLLGTLKPDLLFCNLSRRPPAENIFPNPTKRLNHIFCDLSRPEDTQRAAQDVREILQREASSGGILLINNSGFGSFGSFLELNLAKELEMIDVNVRALVELTGRLLPLLCERGGVVMNIASTVAFQPTPYCATYGATKAFVLHWTLALNEELRGSRVRALAVCPGTTATAFFREAGSRVDAARSAASMTPEDVVKVALRALGAGRSQVVAGWGNKAYTFAGSKLPKPVSARIAGKVLAKRRPRSSEK